SLNTQFCNNQALPCGPGFNGAVHWEVGLIPADACLQSVSVRLVKVGGDQGSIEAAAPGLWMAQNDWSPCQINAPGPPFNELSGFLAGVTVPSPSEAVFSSPRLAGLIEAQVRNRGLLYGTLIRANAGITFNSTLALDFASRPSAVVRFYRVPPIHRP